MTRAQRQQLSCAYCDGLGEIVRIDGTPEVCPVCKPWENDPVVTKHREECITNGNRVAREKARAK